MPEFLGHLTVHYMNLVSTIADKHDHRNDGETAYFTVHYEDMMKIIVSLMFCASMTVCGCCSSSNRCDLVTDMISIILYLNVTFIHTTICVDLWISGCVSVCLLCIWVLMHCLFILDLFWGFNYRLKANDERKRVSSVFIHWTVILLFLLVSGIMQ